MKKDKLRVYIIELLLFIILFLALFVSINRKIMALILFAFSILIVNTIRKKKTKSIYKDQVFYLMIGFAVIHLIVFYLMGLYFGYYEAAAKFSFKTIIDFILPFIVIIISSEVIRNTLISQKAKYSDILVLIDMVLVDLIVYTGVYDITNYDDMLTILGFILFASIACNLLFNYIVVRFGNKGVIAYRLITVLFVYIIPVIPDVYLFFRSFLRMVYPYIIFLVLEYTYSKTNYATAYKDKSKNIIATSVLLVIMVLLIGLISCKFTYGVLVIGSGSMTGTINKGDAVVFKQYKGESVKEGDVIIFDKQDIKTVHRVINVENVNGEYRYYTKGDANQVKDDGYRTKKEIIGKSLFKIRYIGYPSLWLRDLFGEKY